MLKKEGQFRELHFSSNLSMEARKIMKELKGTVSGPDRERLQARLARIHRLQEQMKQGEISDAFVSLLITENFDVVDFIEKFSKEHPVTPRKKGDKELGVLGYLKELLIGDDKKSPKVVTYTNKLPYKVCHRKKARD